MTEALKARGIGGEFEISYNFGSVPVTTDTNPGLENLVWFNAGRSALKQAIKAVTKKRRINDVWIPYYTCKSAILPFVRAGLNIHYFSQGSDLQAAPTLPANLHDTIILFNHYFGQVNSRLCDYLSKNVHSNVVVIEDAVQNCMDPKIPAIGDFIIHGPRKFLPIPDGAAVQSIWDLEEPEAASDENFIAIKILAKQIRSFVGEQFEDEGIRLNKLAEQRLDQDYQARRLSAYSKNAMSYFDCDALRYKRQQNWGCLAEIFSGSPERFGGLRPLFSAMHSDTTPLAFPVVVDKNDRSKIISQLAERRIFCPQHWPIDQPEKRNVMPDYQLSQRLFSLPLDQRYDAHDMEYITETLATVITTLRI